LVQLLAQYWRLSGKTVSHSSAIHLTRALHFRTTSNASRGLTRRNVIHPEGAYINEAAAERDFDVITEIWFVDQAAYHAAMALSAQPEIGGRIAADGPTAIPGGEQP